MSPSQTDVETTIRSFLVRTNKPVELLEPMLPLYAEGIGLDSLETAELSAVLEDTFGTDPFSAGDDMPQTVGDVLRFYEGASARL